MRVGSVVSAVYGFGFACGWVIGLMLFGWVRAANWLVESALTCLLVVGLLTAILLLGCLLLMIWWVTVCCCYVGFRICWLSVC